jgi:hypothetical protein
MNHHFHRMHTYRSMSVLSARRNSTWASASRTLASALTRTPVAESKGWQSEGGAWKGKAASAGKHGVGLFLHHRANERGGEDAE